MAVTPQPSHNPNLKRPTVVAKKATPPQPAQAAPAPEAVPELEQPEDEELEDEEQEDDEEIDETAESEESTDAADAQPEVPPAAVAQASSPPQVVEPTRVRASSTDVQELIERQVRDHLEYLSRCPTDTVTVSLFGDFCNLGENAIRVLQQYVQQGLVTRRWKLAAGRYSLTEQGHETLQALKAKYPS